MQRITIYSVRLCFNELAYIPIWRKLKKATQYGDANYEYNTAIKADYRTAVKAEYRIAVKTGYRMAVKPE